MVWNLAVLELVVMAECELSGKELCDVVFNIYPAIPFGEFTFSFRLAWH